MVYCGGSDKLRPQEQFKVLIRFSLVGDSHHDGFTIMVTVTMIAVIMLLLNTINGVGNG